MRWVALVPLLLSGASLGGCGGAPEPPDPLVYLAIGASDAAGAGAEPATDGYVYLIEDELDQRIDEVLLTLLAIPGADTEQLDAALELLLESEIEPDLVTIWTGANDVIRGEGVDDFAAALENMFERLRARTDGVIVAANIPDLTELPRFRDNPDADVTRARIETFNEAIAEQAADHDVLLVDLYAQEVEDDLVSEDGFHPSDEGHRRIAEEFFEVILPALGLAPGA
jgi:lysophospholipase L1-like esterase